LSNPEAYDVLQLHLLHDGWELTGEFVGWIKKWSDKPFEFWEIGFGWQDEEFGEPFTAEGHAAGIVKILVSAIGEGANRVIFEPYWEEVTGPEDRKYGRGLVTPDGPRLAATAHSVMTTQLGGYQSVERLELGAGIWTYRFVKPQEDVYVVWASENTKVSLPISGGVRVTDLYGRLSVADAQTLPVGPSPIFVATMMNADRR
jgi:hypothetical protein